MNCVDNSPYHDWRATESNTKIGQWHSLRCGPLASLPDRWCQRRHVPQWSCWHRLHRHQSLKFWLWGAYGVLIARFQLSVSGKHDRLGLLKSSRSPKEIYLSALLSSLFSAVNHRRRSMRQAKFEHWGCTSFQAQPSTWIYPLPQHSQLCTDQCDRRADLRNSPHWLLSRSCHLLGPKVWCRPSLCGLLLRGHPLRVGLR